MSAPDFFVVGNPRCGTTWLHSVLASHPEVFMARKELHFFGSDLDFERPRRSLASYRAALGGAAPGQVVGDASVWYLQSELAAEEAAEACPDARAIVCLREPRAWLHSLHGMLVHYADESEPDFARALAQSPQRRAAGSGPCRDPDYFGLVRSATQIRRWRAALGADRVAVHFFEELMGDPRTELKRLFRFLGVGDDLRGLEHAIDGDQRSRHPHRIPRSQRLQTWLWSGWRKRALRGHTKPAPGVLLGLRVLRRLNHKVQPRPDMDPALWDDLGRRVRPQVDALRELVGRPLPPAWTQP